jgi:hypothetical protein
LTSAFVVQTPATAINSQCSNTALFDSRKRQKIASRTKWLESRGAGGAATAAKEGGAAVSAGLMKNEHGLEYAKLVHPDTGASSEIYLYGGVVTSYKDGEGTEVNINKKEVQNILLRSIKRI